jgi:L-lactate dehydrogenase
VKVSILGMGRVGSGLGYQLAEEKSVNELVFVDEIKSLSEGIALDISDAYPESSLKITSGDLPAANNSDILIITASAATDPKIRFRIDLLASNKPVIEKIFSEVKLKKDTKVIMVTNPVEPLVFYATSLSHLSPENVMGFGNSLDTARLKVLLSKKTKTPANRIDVIVIGEHGENMLPIFSSAKIEGKPIELYHLDTAKLMKSLKESGYRVRQLTGGVRFGASRHLFDLVESIIKDKGKIFPVSSHVKRNDYYVIEDVCISLPCKISAKGISEIVEMPMSNEEKTKLCALANSLKEIQENF